jgi:CDP-paratose 2-epimerase
VTGGAGFIGSNYVNRLLQRGEQVLIYANLSRPGARANLAWLEKTFDAVQLVEGDVEDGASEAAYEADVIVHLAGQVA